MEGKCAIPERSVAYKKCAVMNDGSAITVLAGPNQQLVQQILLSDIIVAGRLSSIYGLTSSQFNQNIATVLGLVNLTTNDAFKSSNVRGLQYKQGQAFETIVFIANREAKTYDGISSLIPTIASNIQAGEQLAPADAHEILADFQRQFERAQSLYQELMFEEADRVLDMSIAKANLFSQKYETREGAKDVLTFLVSQVRELQAMRDYKSYDRKLEEYQAEQDYNQVQRQRAEAERQRREHEYRVAAEYRKATEANTLKWYNYWYGRPSTSIYIIR